MIAALQAECQWFFGCDERVNQCRISQRFLTLGKLQWKGDMERVEGIELLLRWNYLVVCSCVKDEWSYAPLKSLKQVL